MSFSINEVAILIEDPQNLDKLKRLRLLSIQSNRITKIEGLEALTELEELYISHNGVEKLGGLESNVRIQTKPPQSRAT